MLGHKVSSPRNMFLFSGVHLSQGLLVAFHPPITSAPPWDYSTNVRLKLSVLRKGGLQVHCTLQESLANREAQTQGLTNHTIEREGRGIKLSTEWD